ncbi:hypothetical protein HPP92_019264 [Vanilla planifolia]|uniref:Uncharacterized protein n=1 Tax=Vanilla planifolia TaxID=51239 RepID=A0A835ULI5_VANPL|nr:hypothetical protein HPP92_019264 [Vanilla planifolia]
MPRKQEKEEKHKNGDPGPAKSTHRIISRLAFKRLRKVRSLFIERMGGVIFDSSSTINAHDSVKNSMIVNGKHPTIEIEQKAVLTT